MKIEGSVAPGFESVRALFAKEMYTKAEDKAQLCVYYKGEKVVDLWARKEHHTDFNADTLVNVFSSGKSLETLAIAALVDKGLLNYDDKISLHWPEFSGDGKDDITVADLMRHEAGLIDFKHTFEPEHLFTENIKQNSVGTVIEGLKAKISSDEGARRNYHALTRGWVVNELFRRVDPNQRTLGEYLRDDIAKPLGADINVGVKDEDLNRRAPVKGLNLVYYFLESLKPRFMGRKVEHSAGNLLAMFSPLILQAGKDARRRKAKKKNRAHSAGHHQGAARKPRTPVRGLALSRDREKVVNFFNQPVIAQGESASFNANCSARGLAKVAAMLAAGGKFEGKEYFGQAAWEALHGAPNQKNLGGTVSTHFTQGGLNLFTMKGSDFNARDRSLNKGREGFYGWMGLGGSIFQWNPDHEIGFAFVPTSMHIVDIFNERGKIYQTEVLRCAQAIKSRAA